VDDKPQKTTGRESNNPRYVLTLASSWKDAENGGERRRTANGNDNDGDKNERPMRKALMATAAGRCGERQKATTVTRTGNR
jgi:hypothetical protein